jgi:4'-phosphopantetheinyl transferase
MKSFEHPAAMQLHWRPTRRAPELKSNEAHVWAVPLNVAAVDLDRFKSLLSPDERRNAEALRTDELQRRSIVAHGTLRMILGRYLGGPPASILFGFEKRGKPIIAGDYTSSALRFNLSHSSDLALVGVVEGCEVGVDIELLREIHQLEPLVRRYFHPTEVDDVLSTPADRNTRFLKCWTAKEAVLKVFGNGIVESLNDFCVPPSGTSSGWVDVSRLPNFPESLKCWVTRLSPGENYEAAIAFVGPERDVRGFVFDA